MLAVAHQLGSCNGLVIAIGHFGLLLPVCDCHLSLVQIWNGTWMPRALNNVISDLEF